MSPSNTDETIFTPPRTPAEELLATIYGVLLGVENVGIRSSFFSLGGSSHLAARLADQLREIFRVDLTAANVLESPTVDQLVNSLARRWNGREIVDEIAWTFMQVEQLSDREANSMLQDQIGQAPSDGENWGEGKLRQAEASGNKRKLVELLLERTGIKLRPEGTLPPDIDSASSDS
jgi:phosphopantetheine binding protein